LRYLLLLVLCLLLVGCQALPTPEQPETDQVETTESDSETAPYRGFFQQLIDQPMSQLMTPFFIDYKDLPGAFVVSAALVDLTGDEIPEVLVAYSSDVPGADALTYTQIYRLQAEQIVPWGQKIPLTIEFFGLNQLVGTSQKSVGKQTDRIYQQYQVQPEVARVAEETIRVITETKRPTSLEGFDQSVSLAKTMASGSTEGDLLVMDQAEREPPFIIFHTKTYDHDRLSRLAERFDMHFVDWRRLDSRFLADLDQLYANVTWAADRHQESSHNEIDLMVAAIEREMQGGSVRSFSRGENTFYYVPELEMRGMRQFRLIKAIIDDTEVYLDQQLPFFLRDDIGEYYPDDASARDKFLSLRQKLRSEVSRQLFRRFLLLDSYDRAVPLSGYEFVPETTP